MRFVRPGTCRIAAIGFLVWASLSGAPAASEPAAPRPVPFEVVVNGAPGGTWVLVEAGGALYAPLEAAAEWRLDVPADAPRLVFRGEPFFRLAGIAGYRAQIDAAAQRLDLAFSPQAFAETRMARERSRAVEVKRPLTSAFVNLDVSAERTETRVAPTLDQAGVLSEIGLSTAAGVLTSSAVSRFNDRRGFYGHARPFTRLETTLTRDFPSLNRTLVIGDTATRAAEDGRSVFFGGVRWGTNFALAPGFITQPVPVLRGVAEVPSTIDLYVGDVLRQTSQVPPGPFAVDNLPQFSGGGEVRMVLRDLLGRETVITRSFLGSGRLLARGLDDWSLEAGAVRRDLGLSSARYGPGFVRGLWRRGWSDTLTLETAAEAERERQSLEAGVAAAVRDAWLGRAALSLSRDAGSGSGAQWVLGLERQDLFSSLFFEIQGSSSRFRGLGHDQVRQPSRLQWAASGSLQVGATGSIGLGAIGTHRHSGERLETWSASYIGRLPNRGQLSLTAAHTRGSTTVGAAALGTSVMLSVLFPIGPARALQVNAATRRESSDLTVEASQSPTIDDGLGWRVLAGQWRDRAQAEASVYYFGRHGQLTADAVATSDLSAVRLSGATGLVLVGGHAFLAQRQSQSFALVELPGHAGVGVGIGNRVLSTTNEAGVALVPFLVPYLRNSIRIDPNDLPVAAEIGSIEETVVPGWRSVVKADFRVRGGRGALLGIMLDDGGPAPAGAVVRVSGDAQPFYVARRGEAFVTGLEPTSRLRLEWNGQHCEFEVSLPPPDPDEIPRVGPLACKGVKR